jgi:hypothetical protein
MTTPRTASRPTVVLSPEHATAIDRAALTARERHDVYVSRAEIVAALVARVLPDELLVIAEELAKEEVR